LAKDKTDCENVIAEHMIKWLMALICKITLVQMNEEVKQLRRTDSSQEEYKWYAKLWKYT
jgi:hypothetical protein